MAFIHNSAVEADTTSMKHMLITGGAGFIGSNAAHHFAKAGYKVTIFDNFSRTGTRDNGAWLTKEIPDITVIEGDIRKPKEIEKAVKGKQVVLHLAGQVAVTTSVTDPRTDFDINALGTFNVLEAVRLAGEKPVFLFSSTNKVYGGMEDVTVIEKNGGYAYKDFPNGISEAHLLDFHSPYGCSKGAADQYVRDYHRIYGIPTVVFRQSCIYGPRQFGIEDQGWVAWFIIATTLSKAISVYGDGKQVRDVLYIDDLIKAFEVAIQKIDRSAGNIYNVGGGATNTLSVWSTFGPILSRLFGRELKASFADWRPGDQKVYISDISRIQKELGWKPTVSVEAGVEKLFHWVQENKELFTIFK